MTFIAFKIRCCPISSSSHALSMSRTLCQTCRYTDKYWQSVRMTKTKEPLPEMKVSLTSFRLDIKITQLIPRSFANEQRNTRSRDWSAWASLRVEHSDVCPVARRRHLNVFWNASVKLTSRTRLCCPLSCARSANRDYWRVRSVPEARFHR